MAQPYAQYKSYPFKPDWNCLGFDRLDPQETQGRFKLRERADALNYKSQVAE